MSEDKDLQVAEMLLDAKLVLLTHIATGKTNPTTAEMIARAYRYLDGGPQPGPVEAKTD